MSRQTRINVPLLAAVAAVAIAVFGAGAAAAEHECSAVTFRTWTQSGNTWFDYGQQVTAEPGVETHLYIHFAGQAPTPYRTSARIGHASEHGYRVREGTAAFRRQNPDDVQAGRLILDAQGQGQAVLGYEITDIAKAGAMASLPPACRKGMVVVQIGDAPVADAPRDRRADERAARLAAQQLNRRLHLALEPWDQDVPQSEATIEEIMRAGRDTIVDMAAAILANDEYPDRSWDWTIESNSDLASLGRQRTPRVGMVADRLLEDIYSRLFGGLRVTPEEHRNLITSLMSCLNRRTGTASCDQLAKDLIEHPNYAQYNAEQLEAIRAAR